MAKVAKKKKVERPLLYPSFGYDLHDELNPLDVDRAKQWIGWTEVDEGVEDYLLKDLNGNKIQCKNNVRNRPLYMTNVNDLKQSILMKRWQFNGEPIIIGKFGSVLNGQHTLIALILAEQERTGRDADKWRTIWKDEPCSIAKLVVYGIDESDETVNTMDTCKARSIPDIIYRNEYFAKMGSKERREACRMSEHAIKFLWERTWTVKDPYAPRRTHDESLKFLDNHRHLVECVRWVHEQGKGKDRERVTLILSLGYMSGLLYLMSATLSDGEAYLTEHPHSEKNVNLECFDSAKEYLKAVINADPRVQKVRDAITALVKSEDPMERGGRQERIAVLIAGWLQFLKDSSKPIHSKDLRLKRATKGNNIVLLDPPVCGGIDKGPNAADADDQEQEQAEADAAKEATPTSTEEGDPTTPPVVKPNAGKGKGKKGKPAKGQEPDPTPEEIAEAKAEKAATIKAQGKGKGKKATAPVEVESQESEEGEESTTEEGEGEEAWVPPPSKADLAKRKGKSPAPNGRLQPAGVVVPALAGAAGLVAGATAATVANQVAESSKGEEGEDGEGESNPGEEQEEEGSEEEGEEVDIGEEGEEGDGFGSDHEEEE